MTEYAIDVHDLGKRHFIARKKEINATLMGTLAQVAKQPLRRFRDLLGGNQTGAADLDQEFWALRHASFSVTHGETVGVIGHNGAGKSTLLKLLSRITAPTEGYADITGRVGSLLEVGTGFNPELTGRENIYFNGSILGMTTQEINNKFDEIVAFSGVEQFVDTPVKHYSSGMAVRLAFAVAAHLEPEILLIDEVLSVGDIEFQRKSIGKMSDVAQSGRTILFVSHNLAAVRSFCERVIVLNHGRIVFDGDVEAGLTHYMTQTNGGGTTSHWRETETTVLDDDVASVHEVRVLDSNHELRQSFLGSEPIIIEMLVQVKQWSPDLRIGFDLDKFGSGTLLRTWHNDQGELFNADGFQPGFYRLQSQIPPYVLNSDMYAVSPVLGIHNKRYIAHRERVVSFQVDFHSPNEQFPDKARVGIAALSLPWTLTPDVVPSPS